MTSRCGRLGVCKPKHASRPRHVLESRTDATTTGLVFDQARCPRRRSASAETWSMALGLRRTNRMALTLRWRAFGAGYGTGSGTSRGPSPLAYIAVEIGA